MIVISERAEMVIWFSLIVALIISTMALIPIAYGSEPEIVEIKSHSIAFLVGTCDQYDHLQKAMPDVWVYCTNENYLASARVHYSQFEVYFNVVYVLPYGSNVGYGQYGETFHDGNKSWSWSVPFYVAILHELQHQECGCYKTPDGVHG